MTKTEQSGHYWFFHPINVLATCVLILNDHFLKDLLPSEHYSWLTFHLSDFAGAIIVPAVLLLLVGIVMKNVQSSCMMVAIVSCTLLFLLETNTTFMMLYEFVFTSLMPVTGLDGVAETTADYWDLLALPLCFWPCFLSSSK